ncbi:DUF6056 family protein [Dysgonomonas sp. Marseille-P4361]|uniref:DUF3329 domain-containing protein n=1 Tax=Dysgonomonas sp. Marseille-P4361 TaxID=2161820 RepID=UPI000D551A69|nr:DUF6056 family protein [Dysgonomonas sp. Marseille-P4361]
MLDKEKATLNKLLLSATILVTFIGIYALNHYFPLFNDDWLYSFVFGRDTDRVSSFADVIESQYNHYFLWGGRSVAHTIAQSFLYIGEAWADILNSLAYVALITLIYTTVNYRHQVNIFLYIGISALIWFLAPDLMVCIAWLTGSANYLWGCMLVISILYPYSMYYLKYDNTKQQRDSILKCAIFLFWGIIAGWTNENLVAGLLSFLFLFILLLKYEKKAIPKWAIFGFIGVAIGCFIMLSAPGNFIRNKIELNTIHGIADGKPELSYYYYRMISVIKTFFVYGIVPAIIYIVTAIVHWKWGKKEYKQTVFRLSLLFFIMAIVATVVMAAAPIFPERVWFSIIVLIITATLLLYMNLDFSFKPLYITNYIIWIPLIALFFASYSFSLKDTIRLRETFDNREQYVLKEKKNGTMDFLFYDRFVPQEYPIFTQKVYDIPHLKDYLWEDAYAKYYGITSIEIKYDR